MLSEISQEKANTMISLMWNSRNKTAEERGKVKKKRRMQTIRNSAIENRLPGWEVGVRGRAKWEVGITEDTC